MDLTYDLALYIPALPTSMCNIGHNLALRVTPGVTEQTVMSRFQCGLFRPAFSHGDAVL